jgi:hypothetical protein
MPTEITGACGATVCGTHGTTRRVDTTVRCPPPLRASCPAPGTALRLPARTVRLRHGVHVHAGRCRAHADRPRTLAGRQRVRAGRPGKAGVRCSNQLVLWPGEHCGHVSVKAIVIGQLQEGSGVHGAGLHAQLNAAPDTYEGAPAVQIRQTMPAGGGHKRKRRIVGTSFFLGTVNLYAPLTLRFGRPNSPKPTIPTRKKNIK